MLVLILLLFFRLEITSFHSPQASGGARAVGVYRNGGRAVGSVRSSRESRSRSQTVFVFVFD